MVGKVGICGGWVEGVCGGFWKILDGILEKLVSA